MPPPPLLTPLFVILLNYYFSHLLLFHLKLQINFQNNFGSIVELFQTNSVYIGPDTFLFDVSSYPSPRAI